MDSKTGTRQLKIKSGILKRCVKEYGTYMEEMASLEEKVLVLKAEEAEAGIISRAEDQVAETAAVLPSCATKIQNGIPELEGVMDECRDNEEITSTEDWQNAEAVLAQAKLFLESI